MLFCDSPRLVNLSLEFQLRGNGVSSSSTIGYRPFNRSSPCWPNGLAALPLTAAEPLPPPTAAPPPQSEFTTVVLLLLLFGLAAICTAEAAVAAAWYCFDPNTTRTGAEDETKKTIVGWCGEGRRGGVSIVRRGKKTRLKNKSKTLRASPRTVCLVSNRENCESRNGTATRIIIIIEYAIATTTKTTATAAIATSGTYHRDGPYAHTLTRTRTHTHSRPSRAHAPLTRPTRTQLCYVIIGTTLRLRPNNGATTTILQYDCTTADGGSARSRRPSSFYAPRRVGGWRAVVTGDAGYSR